MLLKSLSLSPISVDVSLAVPVTNSLKFLFTVLVGIYLKEPIQKRRKIKDLSYNVPSS